MPKIFESKVFALHYQVCLIDKEDHNPYPEWKTGEEQYVFGSKGIAVGLHVERNVTAAVYKDTYGGAKDKYLGNVQISIGEEGILVGNVEVAETHEIPIPKGEYNIDIYVAETANSANVDFVIINNIEKIKSITN